LRINIWVCSQFGPPILNIFSWIEVAHPVAVQQWGGTRKVFGGGGDIGGISLGPVVASGCPFAPAAHGRGLILVSSTNICIKVMSPTRLVGWTDMLKSTTKWNMFSDCGTIKAGILLNLWKLSA
jgi:hypothetical protein